MIKQIKDLNAATIDDLNDDCQFVMDDSNDKTKRVSLNVLKQKIRFEGEILNLIYPIGSIYTTITNSDTCPFEGVDGMHWEKIASGKCLFGADENHNVGSEISAGLPNIKGLVQYVRYQDTGLLANGAFNGSTNTSALLQNFWGGVGNAASGVLDFNASYSNPIYGNSSTVQPPAIAVIFWRRVS